MPSLLLALVLTLGAARAAPVAQPVSPETAANCLSPRFSADGSQLSWERNDHKARTVALWVADTAGGAPRQAAPLAGTGAPSAAAGFATARRSHAATGAVWAPRTASARLRRRFIYAQSAGGDDYDLFVLDGDGPLVSGPGADGDVAWSPGAPDRIVFTSARTGGGDLYLLPLGGSPQRLTRMDDSAELAPTLSPDGKSVVFVAHSDRGDNLWRIADLDAPGPPAPLTRWTGSQGRPQWSPDGRFIAFYALDAGPGDRVDLVVSTPAGQSRTVAEGVVPDSNGPSWSPDGSRLVFVLDRDDELDPVAVAAPEGGAPVPLALGTVGNRDLAVARSPDGTGLLIAVSAQGAAGDTTRDFRRVYLARLDALP